MRTQLIRMNSGGTGQKPTKFRPISDVDWSLLLLMRTYRQWYSNSFSNTSATNACGISLHAFITFSFLSKLLVAIATSLDTSEKKYSSIICTKSAFIWWKNCKNRSSISWDIRLNTLVFTARGYAKRGICRRRVCVCLSHSGIVSQVALLLQRDRARHLWVQILQLQNISLENPIVWHYLRDSTFSRCDTIPEWDRHTHRQTDGQTHDDGIYRT